MARRKREIVNVYLPEHYNEALEKLRERLPGSFSQAIQAHLRELFKKFGIPFTDKEQP